jgi:hypothetical protein
MEGVYAIKMDVRCKSAVEDLLPAIRAGLNHPDGMIRLTMFTHDSPGIQLMNRRITEAIVMAIEQDHTISRKRKRA